MYVTNKPATAIIIALAAFLIATLALACSSATPRAGDVNTTGPLWQLCTTPPMEAVGRTTLTG